MYQCLMSHGFSLYVSITLLQPLVEIQCYKKLNQAYIKRMELGMTEMIEMTEESTSSFQLEYRDKIPIDFKVPLGYADARHF